MRGEIERLRERESTLYVRRQHIRCTLYRLIYQTHYLSVSIELVVYYYLFTVILKRQVPQRQYKGTVTLRGCIGTVKVIKSEKDYDENRHDEPGLHSVLKSVQVGKSVIHYITTDDGKKLQARGMLMRSLSTYRL